jgi:RNA polymerase sigma-32 factor
MKVQFSDLDRHFVKNAMNAPYLEREHEHALALRWKEFKDKSALDQMTSAHMRLAISLSARYRNYGLSMADLVQEAHIGLMEAAMRFEPAREIRFSTYASWWIRASIQDFILRNWSIVRSGTSSNQKALFFNLRRLRAKLEQTEPEKTRTAFATIAAALRVPLRDVESMNMRLSGSDVSLNAPVSDEEGASERGDFLVDQAPLQDEVISDAMNASNRHDALNMALKKLNPRELIIVQQRHLMEKAPTLEVLGQSLGISKERVRQIESRAIEKLRVELTREMHQLV